jgi:4-hydroxy-tetrahydrodipicolinate synthase
MVKAHTDFCIRGGVNTVLASAGSGQYVNMTIKQREDTVKAVVDGAAGRVPVLAGILEPGLGEAIENAKRAIGVGAEALVVLPPYYVTVTQEGIYDYYAELEKTVNAPIIVYNYPGRVGTNVMPETLARLMKDIPNIIGVKECSDYTQFLNAVRLIGDNGTVFSASDLAFADQVLAGAKGGIIAASCILPREYAEIYKLAKAGKAKEAHDLIFQYFALVKGLFGNGQHPSPLKYAMGLMGQEIGEWLTPLREPDEATREILRSELKKHGMI